MREATSQIETSTSQTGVQADAKAATDEGGNKRRGARLSREIRITVSGADALGQPFRESVKTLSISCYGCKYPSKNYVPKGSVVALEIPRHGSRSELRVAHGRVIWVQRPRNTREIYQIAVELEVPGNIWGIADAPESWFAHPDDEKLTVVEPDVAPPVVASPVRASPAPEPMPASTATVISTGQASVSRFEEVEFTRKHLDGEIEQAIVHTVKVIAERIAGSMVDDIVQDAAKRAMAAIEKARQSGLAIAEDLDAKIRQVLDETLAEQNSPRPRKRMTRRRKPPRVSS